MNKYNVKYIMECKLNDNGYKTLNLQRQMALAENGNKITYKSYWLGTEKESYVLPLIILITGITPNGYAGIGIYSNGEKVTTHFCAKELAEYYNIT